VPKLYCVNLSDLGLGSEPYYIAFHVELESSDYASTESIGLEPPFLLEYKLAGVNVPCG
jgi:hypothetical protein